MLIIVVSLLLVLGVTSDRIVSWNKPTVQSSILNNAVSSLAVDGNYGSNHLQSCTQTIEEKGYWMVDLEKEYRITKITLYNRGDVHSERLIGVVIELLSTDNVVIHQCGIITEDKPKYTFQCYGHLAQKVRVRHTRKDYLTICELDVTADLVDRLVSRYKPTVQSSTFVNSDSIKAVDGNYKITSRMDEKGIWHNDCAQTYEEIGYWMVDLGEAYSITNIVLYNRGDIHSKRLIGAVIELLSKENVLIRQCGTITADEPLYTFQCHGHKGQKVRIRHTRKDYLTICELDVFSDFVDRLVSRYKPTVQSSTLNGAVSSKAVDGNYKIYHWMDEKGIWHNDCAQTEEEIGYWMVDLGEAYRITNIVLHNRGDIHSKRLIGVVVELLSRENVFIHQCGVITSDVPVYTFQCGGFKGQKVRVRHTRKDFLTICELDVFSEEFR